MGKVTGFMEYTREVPGRRPVAERVNDFQEVYQEFPEQKLRLQAARCMDCGVPFCHTGCPLNNVIRIGTTSSIAIAGRKPSAASTPRTTSPNLPDGYARRPAKLPAFWVLTTLL